MGVRLCYVILGGGLAGHSAAETLREAGFDGRIVVIDAEPVRPYDRTLLSKAFLQGKREADNLFLRPTEHYAGLEVEILLHARATAVDPAARRITINGRDTIEFTKLLIATGAKPIRLSLPGFDLPGVHYLRTLAEAISIRSELVGAARVLVVGAGFIGSEVAAVARGLGHEVTLADPLSAPMMGALGGRIGGVFGQLHRRHGVDVRMGSGVAELRGGGRVEEAVLTGGERIPCDLVIVGIGVRPEVGLFQGTDVLLDNGVVVDEYCRSNLPNIYAAGDVAHWWHPGIGRRLRVEHFDNAALQGTAAGWSMAGTPKSYRPLPYFWSDQYDINLQYVGYAGPSEQLVLRGDIEEPSFSAFYLVHERLQAAVMVNRPRDVRPARRLVEMATRLEPGALADPTMDLRSLAK